MLNPLSGPECDYVIRHDGDGQLRVVGPELKRHPYLVRVDKPGVDIETVALMAKVGDNADGVHTFDGRSDISNEEDAEQWIKSHGAEVAQLKSSSSPFQGKSSLCAHHAPALCGAGLGPSDRKSGHSKSAQADVDR